MNRLPGEPEPADRDGFLTLAAFVAHLESYARSFAAPVVEGVEVERIERAHGGFRVSTTSGAWLARSVVLATGDAAEPHVPLRAAAGAALAPLVRVPSPGARAGRTGHWSSGPGRAASSLRSSCSRRGATSCSPPDATRARRADTAAATSSSGPTCWATGTARSTRCRTSTAAKRVPLFPLSGANGGEDLGLDRLAASGVTVTGRLMGFAGGRAVFADDLDANVAAADARLRKLLRRIDAHPLAEGSEPEPLPDVILPPAPRTLDLRRVGAIVWATGFRRSYPWLHVPGVARPARRDRAASRRDPCVQASTRSGSRTSTGATPTSSAASAATPRRSRKRSSSADPGELGGLRPRLRRDLRTAANGASRCEGSRAFGAMVNACSSVCWNGSD